MPGGWRVIDVWQSRAVATRCDVHFHIVDGVVLDTLGATLPTDEAARVHAEKMAHRFTRAEVGMLREKAVKVPETGATLFLSDPA